MKIHILLLIVISLLNARFVNGYKIERKLGGYDGRKYNYYSGKIIFVAVNSV